MFDLWPAIGKNAKHYDKGGEKIYNDDYQSKDFFLKAEEVIYSIPRL